MVSKEKYKEFINDLMNEDTKYEYNKKHIAKYGTSKYKRVSNIFLCLSAIFVLLPLLVLILSGGSIKGTYVHEEINSFAAFMRYLRYEIASYFLSISFIIGVCLFAIGIFKKANIAYLQVVNKSYKNKYLKKVISFLLSDYAWNFSQDGEIKQGIFYDSELIENYFCCKGRDKLYVTIPYSRGKDGNVCMEVCDMSLVKRIPISTNKLYTRYLGAFLYIEFPFEFSCTLCVNVEGAENNFEAVVLEDITFNNNFKVLSDDQIEARYILTPDIMEKLLILNTKYNDFKLAFRGNRIYMLFPKVNFFEVVSTKGGASSVFESIYDDVCNILGIIEEIKNNNKVFKIENNEEIKKILF